MQEDFSPEVGFVTRTGIRRFKVSVKLPSPAAVNLLGNACEAAGGQAGARVERF